MGWEVTSTLDSDMQSACKIDGCQSPAQHAKNLAKPEGRVPLEEFRPCTWRCGSSCNLDSRGKTIPISATRVGSKHRREEDCGEQQQPALYPQGHAPKSLISPAANRGSVLALTSSNRTIKG